MKPRLVGVAAAITMGEDLAGRTMPPILDNKHPSSPSNIRALRVPSRSAAAKATCNGRCAEYLHLESDDAIVWLRVNEPTP